MNKVIITGKITRVNYLDTVVYATICTYTNGKYEFIPVTIFQKDFFGRYFHQGKWITVEGHIHINKHNEKYTTEIIADNLSFAGDMGEIDKQMNELLRDNKASV